MIAESDAEGRALLVFMAGLAGALGALADYPTSAAAPAEVGDTLDDLVKAFRQGEHNVFEALKADAHLTDPWARSMPKVIAEVAGTHGAFVAVLAAWENAWWTRRIEELDRRQQDQQRHEAVR